MLIIIFSPEVLQIIAKEEFYPASDLVPWLVFGAFLAGLYFIPMNVISQIVGNTSRVSIATITAGSINIGLNLWLVPQYGIKAAAINTVIGYAILLSLIYLISQRLCKIQYEYKRIGKIILSMLLVILLSQFINNDNLLFSFLLKSGMLLSFPLLLFIMNFMNTEERKKIKGIIHFPFGSA